VYVVFERECAHVNAADVLCGNAISKFDTFLANKAFVSCNATACAKKG
jgi:hypothetical protein